MNSRQLLLTVLFVSVSIVSLPQGYLTIREGKYESDTEKSQRKSPVFRFEAYPITDLEAISGELAGIHSFGTETAKKYYLFDQKYTYQESFAPGDPASKTVIRKPLIYESVKKIEHDLKRSVKNGKLPVAKAANEFNKVLDVAISVISADSGKFEEALAAASTTESKIELFTNRVILIR